MKGVCRSGIDIGKRRRGGKRWYDGRWVALAVVCSSVSVEYSEVSTSASIR